MCMISIFSKFESNIEHSMLENEILERLVGKKTAKLTYPYSLALNRLPYSAKLW